MHSSVRKDSSDEHPRQGQKKSYDVLIYNSKASRYIWYSCSYRGELTFVPYLLWYCSSRLQFLNSNLSKQSLKTKLSTGMTAKQPFTQHQVEKPSSWSAVFQTHMKMQSCELAPVFRTSGQPFTLTPRIGGWSGNFQPSFLIHRPWVLRR